MNTVMFIQFLIVYDWFCITTAEFSSYKRLNGLKILKYLLSGTLQILTRLTV